MTDAKSGARPTVLCILDGWGERAERQNNAVALADTPHWDRMVGHWPTSTMEASAADVGLPAGQMGNSEVGHMNLGAGRIVWQDLPRINTAIEDGSMAREAALARFIDTLQASGGACHLIGLISDGGVHSMTDHALALIKALSSAGIAVKIHAFTDGRDTPPRAAAQTLQKFMDELADLGAGAAKIVTLSGRYFAMDRDNRWDRVKKAYDVMASAKGDHFSDPLAAIAASLDSTSSDEFIVPAVIGDYAGMSDGDGLLMINYRADRVRQILAALCDPEFSRFERPRQVKFAAALGMVSYSKPLDKFLDVIFVPHIVRNGLGEVIAAAGLKQYRLAETEKYAHVTFFFNGRREEPFAGEVRELVPSPQVATYDLQPEMSAGEVTDKLLAAIGSGKYGLIIVNYANGDMVGHTGDLNAAIKAAAFVDGCLGKVERAVIDAGGAMLVTADHGNCELMVDPVTGAPHTSHTMNVVPTVLVNYAGGEDVALAKGRLADVAPTLLEMMQLKAPADMTGSSLIKHHR